MNPDTKARLATVLLLVRVTFNYGYIPFVIYLGNLVIIKLFINYFEILF